MTPNEKIRARRIELGLTQEEVAKRMGFESRGIVNRYENGRELTLKKAKEFAVALDTTPAYLLGLDSKAVDYVMNLGSSECVIQIEAMESDSDRARRLAYYFKILSEKGKLDELLSYAEFLAK